MERLWSILQSEAREQARQEPQMADFLRRAILDHGDWRDAHREWLVGAHPRPAAATRPVQTGLRRAHRYSQQRLNPRGGCACPDTKAPAPSFDMIRFDAPDDTVCGNCNGARRILTKRNEQYRVDRDARDAVGMLRSGDHFWLLRRIVGRRACAFEFRGGQVHPAPSRKLMEGKRHLPIIDQRAHGFPMPGLAADFNNTIALSLRHPRNACLDVHGPQATIAPTGTKPVIAGRIDAA